MIVLFLMMLIIIMIITVTLITVTYEIILRRCPVICLVHLSLQKPINSHAVSTLMSDDDEKFVRKMTIMMKMMIMMKMKIMMKMMIMTMVNIVWYWLIYAQWGRLLQFLQIV